METTMGRRIEVVEDDPLIAWELQSIVTKAGYDCIGLAYTEDEAVRIAKDMEPDVILMDINLGRGGNGMEAAKRIMSDRETCIIFCSAYIKSASMNDELISLGKGMISKPFRAKQITDLIAAVCPPP
jgi:DNA-binding response OmpR family regulator